MTKQEIENLITLRKENFDYREWLALSFAREWIFNNGNISEWVNLNEYKKVYSLQERKYILKLVKMMDFFNCAGNIFIRIPWKYSVERSISCSLPSSENGDLK